MIWSFILAFCTSRASWPLRAGKQRRRGGSSSALQLRYQLAGRGGRGGAAAPPVAAEVAAPWGGMLLAPGAVAPLPALEQPPQQVRTCFQSTVWRPLSSRRCPVPQMVGGRGVGQVVAGELLTVKANSTDLLCEAG